MKCWSVGAIMVAALLLGACAVWADEERERRPEAPPVNEEEVLGFAKEHMPEQAQELGKLRAESPELYKRRLMEIAQQMQRIRELKRQAPEVAEALLRSQDIERECQKLAEKVRHAETDQQREELAAKMRQMLNEVFELRLKQPESDIRRMAQEIERVKGVVERRKANREKIVEKRLKELLEEPKDELAWW